MKKINIKNWDDIKKEITGFLAFNPRGSLNDLFEMQGNTFRTKYYNYKPNDYVFPNQKILTKYRKNKSNKKSSNGTSQNKHVKAFRAACECDLKTLYHVMEENNLDKYQAPEDWKDNKQIYVELMVEAVKNYLNPPLEQEEEEEYLKPQKTASEELKAPEPKKITNSNNREDDIKQYKIDKLMDIAKMIAEVK